MSCVKFYSLNLATQTGTDITAASEDPFFPASNIKDPRTTKVFRSVSGTSTTNIVFDFQTIETINSFLVVGSSINGFGFNGALTLELNGTDSWGSPAFSTTLTPSTEFNFGLKTFSNQSYRFARIVGTGTSFFELSKVFIGKSTELSTNNIDYNWRFENDDRSSFTQNRYGQRFFDEINDQKSIRANYRFLNKTEFDTIADLFNFHGKTIPIWIVVDDTETIVNDLERFAGYFYFRSRPSFSNPAFSLYNTSFRLEEAL